MTTSRATPATPRARRGRVAAVLGVIGEILITAGVVTGLFVVYSLWWTNVVADRQARQDGDRVRRHWAEAPEADPVRTFAPEDGIGFLHVPAMGRHYQVLVKKGTSTEVLNEGVAGYYTGPTPAAMPWAKAGNFTLAAHRDGHGARFHRIDRIHPGDPIVFESRDTWYVYRVYKVLPQTSKYDVAVTDSIPRESGRTTPGRYLTLTTCTPVYTSRYRYVVWAELTRSQHVDARRTLPAELR